MLGVAMAFTSFGATGLVVHQVSYLKQSVGFSGQTAAAVATTMTIISLFGRLAFGSLADFFSKKKLLATGYVLTAVGTFFFASLPSPWQVVFYLALFSPGWGASIAVRPVLQSEYFGLRAFAGIQGLMFAVSGVGAVLGPIFIGGTFDLLGDYRPAFLVTACAALAAAPLVLFMPSPKIEEETGPVVIG
jgi:MFS family permease